MLVIGNNLRLVRSKTRYVDPKKMDSEVDTHFNEYRKTNNQGVFDAYTKEIRRARIYCS